MRLRTLILVAATTASALFFGGTYLVLDQVFERVITEEVNQHTRTTAKLTFNSMYELMSTGWSRHQVESFLRATEAATSDTPSKLHIYRGPLVERQFGVIEQPALDAELRQVFADGKALQSTAGDRVRYIFPLRAEEKCLYCHLNVSVGSVMGAIDVVQDVGPRLASARAEFLRWAGAVIPIAFLLAFFIVRQVRIRVEKPLARLQRSVDQVNALTDLRHVQVEQGEVGIREFDNAFAALDRLLARIRDVAVDKDILQFEIGLLEKFVITSDVVRDWREYVARLLEDINQVVSAHLLFSIFKIDDELFDLEVFWRYRPEDVTREMLEHYIQEEISHNPQFSDLPQLRVHHHYPSDGNHTVALSEEDVRLQVKSFFVETPKIGGIVGIGVQTDVLRDSTLRLVMDSVLSTLMNVVGSVKAIYKYTRDLEYYATRDPLTDLFNQRVFWELLEYERLRAQRHGYSFSLLVIDLDNFKLVNDGFGHAFGDKFLQAFAVAVKEALRVGDIFARYGGDEFVVVLPESALDEAQQVAQRVLEAAEAMTLEAPDGSSVHGAASIGIATYPTHADAPRDLFLFADNMMYKAKAEGKHRIGLPTEADVVEVFQGITQQSVLIIKALDEKLVVPFFQPIVDTHNHEIAAYEVLSRIELDGRIVGANEFVEIAERIGVIHRLDTLVMERALECIAAQGHKGKVFLNLSPRAMVLSEFGRTLLDVVANSGVPPQQIVFEITERDTIKNLALLERFLNDLKFEGFGLAIDDFGSGFSSFHYLRRFPIDYLKIEGDFIVNMRRHGKDRAFVQSMQSLAAELGIKTIAEFVEDGEILADVAGLNVDLAQGYYLGRPARALLAGKIWTPPAT
ncbi:MAG TPA: bifunctional diguanylate cyclase/phosphodiesterase [Rhodocyclaceae bacterium]